MRRIWARMLLLVSACVWWSMIPLSILCVSPSGVWGQGYHRQWPQYSVCQWSDSGRQEVHGAERRSECGRPEHHGHQDEDLRERARPLLLHHRQSSQRWEPADQNKEHVKCVLFKGEHICWTWINADCNFNKHCSSDQKMEL